MPYNSLDTIEEQPRTRYKYRSGPPLILRGTRLTLTIANNNT